MNEMRKLLIINGIVTAIGFCLDVYGVLNLNFSVALAGLIIGIADSAVFLWMVKKERD